MPSQSSSNQPNAPWLHSSTQGGGLRSTTLPVCKHWRTHAALHSLLCLHLSCVHAHHAPVLAPKPPVPVCTPCASARSQFKVLQRLSTHKERLPKRLCAPSLALKPALSCTPTQRQTAHTHTHTHTAPPLRMRVLCKLPISAIANVYPLQAPSKCHCKCVSSPLQAPLKCPYAPG